MRMSTAFWSKRAYTRVRQCSATIVPVYSTFRAWCHLPTLPFPGVPLDVSPALAWIERSWESFVDSLGSEQKALNVLFSYVTFCLLKFLVSDA